ncbi:hypothetical protein L1987_35694 [Smallanthus sonchifolius]|uniref:Uncharacterized protein n=1 Tax=Smallanthus sonchifolius TaxID=185202 RepID=A0ACB9HCM9_9ASTR|nr:hypothetical protein L1987_35694 [Smallanthus sonchifolius]
MSGHNCDTTIAGGSPLLRHSETLTLIESVVFSLSPVSTAAISGEFAMAVPAQLTSEAVNQLREGIELLLGRWSALQVAIQNERGGRDTRQKAQQLTLDIYQWLIRPSEALYVDKLENLLDDFMLSLNTETSDGSIEEIEDQLMIMHEECLEGNFVSIGRMGQSVPTSDQHMQVVIGGEDDSDSTSSSGDESMDMADNLYNSDTAHF